MGDFHAPTARVLVVDDTKVSIRVLRSLLKDTQMKVDMAISGKQALKLAGDNYYDIMLIDHLMPEMDGIETMHRIREMNPDLDTVYIAMTSNVIPGARERYIEAGFHDFFPKPVSKEDLEDLLKSKLPADKVES
ncbi:MAG: response regulator [Lachnospiraceae bacterium]|nr:response regulator [Lachnospiraceae bacterium]